MSVFKKFWEELTATNSFWQIPYTDINENYKGNECKIIYNVVSHVYKSLIVTNKNVKLCLCLINWALGHEDL
jgi:hypothetical protein